MEAVSGGHHHDILERLLAKSDLVQEHSTSGRVGNCLQKSEVMLPVRQNYLFKSDVKFDFDIILI